MGVKGEGGREGRSQPSSELPGGPDTSLERVLGLAQALTAGEVAPQMLCPVKEAVKPLVQFPRKALITLLLLFAWLFLCHIKRQHVLLTSVGFP